MAATTTMTVRDAMPSLYNQIGVRLDGDAYDVGTGFDRIEVKAAMLIGFNADNEDKAVRALARDKHLRHNRCHQIFDAIRERHRSIKGAFFSDKGVELMNLDSKIAMAVDGRGDPINSSARFHHRTRTISEPNSRQNGRDLGEVFVQRSRSKRARPG